MQKCIKKGQFLLAFLFLLFSSLSVSQELDPELLNQFVRVLHASPESGKTYKTEFINRHLYSSTTQYFEPIQEIEATRSHLTKLSENNETHQYYCQFPATYEIIKAFTPNLPSVGFENCPEIGAKLVGLKDISIIFAAGYMGNPASYFGHMFIKLDQGEASLKSTTFNIGAAVPQNEPPLLYMLRGLSGAYNTEYKETAYYKQAHSYSQIEGRDIYEYKLKLSESHKYLLALHLLELHRMNFTYYFTNRNCAHEILKFIQTLSDTPDMASKPMFYPVHLIDYMQRHGLIAEATYIPANKTKFSQLYYQLTQGERHLLDDTLNKLSHGRVAIRDIAKGIDIKMAEVIVTYAYAHLDEKTDKQLFNNIKRLRLSFPANDKSNNSQFVQKNLSSRPPITVSADYLHLNGVDGLNLSFRPAHYNQNDRPSDVALGGKLVFLQADVLVTSTPRLRKITIVDVYKSEIGKTGLHGDDEHEWALYAGYENIYLDSNEYAKLFSAKGYVGDNLYIGASFWLQYGIEVGARNNIQDYGGLFVSPKINILGNLAQGLHVHLSVGYELSRIGGQKDQFVYELSSYKQLSRSFGLHIKLAKNTYGSSGQLGINYYY